MALKTEDGIVHAFSSQSNHPGHDWTRCRIRVWLMNSERPYAPRSAKGTGTFEKVNCLDCLGAPEGAWP